MALRCNPHVKRRQLVRRELANPGTQCVFIVETDLVLDPVAEGFDAAAIEVLNQQIAEDLGDFKVDAIEIVPFVPEGQNPP